MTAVEGRERSFGPLWYLIFKLLLLTFFFLLLLLKVILCECVDQFSAREARPAVTVKLRFQGEFNRAHEIYCTKKSIKIRGQR